MVSPGEAPAAAAAPAGPPPDPYPVTPFAGPARGAVEVPGSKSLTNRSMVMAALSEGEVTVRGALFSRDTYLLADALAALGFAVRSDEAAGTLTVGGRGGEVPGERATIEVGNAGTAARFIPALALLREGGTYRFDGDAAMRLRPVRGLLDAAAAAGAAEVDYHGEPGFFPFTLRTRGLGGGRVEVDAGASSQILSALLMVAPLARAEVTLASGPVRPSFVRLTLAAMRAFGQAVEDPEEAGGGLVFRVPAPRPYAPPGGTFTVEADASAASYFAALPLAVGGEVTLPGYPGDGSAQGDRRFAEVLERAGVYRRGEGDLEGRVFARGGTGAEGGAGAPALDVDFNGFSDTFLTLAALAPLLPGPLRIRGIGHTRLQETDRVAGMAAELRKLGQGVTEGEDTLEVVPNRGALCQRAARAVGAGEPLTVQTYEDHRFAMSFAVLASHDLLGDGTPWLRIADPACCGKTFPRFFEALERLRADSAMAGRTAGG